MDVLLCLNLPSKASSLPPSLLVGFRPVVSRAYILSMPFELFINDILLQSRSAVEIGPSVVTALATDFRKQSMMTDPE